MKLAESEYKTMAKRISVIAVAQERGYDSVDAYIASGELEDSIVPACCEDGCEVEPDGKCEHGHPSVLLALEVI